jgi:hypothetical protein
MTFQPCGLDLENTHTYTNGARIYEAHFQCLVEASFNTILRLDSHNRDKFQIKN